MNQYRFSPIQDKEELVDAVRYVATETTRLAEKVIGESFPIKSLTIFSHDQSEYESLIEILFEVGRPYNENNGPRVELFEPIRIGNNSIKYLRIRKPDAERPQVGCNDFEMIEFRDLSFDVLAYVVSS